MNWGLSEDVKKAFLDVSPYERPCFKLPSVFDCNWLAGFAEGESNFAVRVSTSVTNKLGKSVSLRFTITQHERDILLMNSIEKFFSFGQVKKRPAQPYIDFIVTNLKDINEKIIPFFWKISFNGL